MTRIILSLLGFCIIFACLSRNIFATEPQVFNLHNFGAVGDGVADDGPAFQKALNALAGAGGGTLFIPEGKYAIATPVFKDFTATASSITIMGVESLTPVAPPTALGSELAEELHLLSEVYPRTGATQTAISIVGLRSLVIKDIAFIGTQEVNTDAAVTLLLTDVEKAQIKHSEFYGLATLVGYGAVVKAVRSDLEIAQCKFLGSTGNSGVYTPIVENTDWLGVTVLDTTFLDYGNRDGFYSKTGLAAPISWINIGNAAPPTNDSPRREVVLRNVFLDEGGWWGLSVLPYRYNSPSAPIDLIYITGLVMNVSNFGQFGHQIYDARRVFIENSSYGWSHNAAAAIALNNISTAILDHLNCVADADHIYADSRTEELTVINSTYAELLSSAKKTNTINTETDEEDPVQYVRGRFVTAIGREPDAAAHFYWSDLLIHCDGDLPCNDGVKEALNNYLASSPASTFGISGRILDTQGLPFNDVTITLSGSQSVSTTPDSDGYYHFNNLPTSGRYSITPA
ncbi:MAG TPA: glycosyl hydrolase family 28-related protein, partial [Pyrinomonadaceae bacterium]|nr:glycosyl hydrolase family 28-related protein [Pyrinomonadaceae bacterium]